MALPPEQREPWKQGILANAPLGMARSARATLLGVTEPIWHRLEEITVPTLVVCGSEDPSYADDARPMAERLPRCLLEMVEGAGHPIVLERPGKLITAMQRFFADLP